MEFLTYVFIGLAVAFIVPLVLRGFGKANEKTKKRYPGPHNRTKIPNGFVRFFFGAAIFFFAAMVAFGIVVIVLHAPYLLMFIGVDVVILGGLAGLTLFGYAHARLCYEVFDDEKITVVRYSKRKTYRYDEIAFYSFGGIVDTNNIYAQNIYSIMLTGLIAYDSDGVKLFESEGINIGVEDLAEKLKAHGVQAVDPRLIYEQFRGNPRHVRSKRKTTFKMSAWFAFGFALCSLLLGGMVYSMTSYSDYTESGITGTVQSITSNGNYCTITLYGDEKSYHINSIVYDVADENLITDIVKGSNVEITVGYTDNSGRPNVIGLSSDGKTYLDSAAARRAETENVDIGRMGAKVCLGIGAALMVVWAICLAIYKVKYSDKSAESDVGAATDK